MNDVVSAAWRHEKWSNKKCCPLTFFSYDHMALHHASVPGGKLNTKTTILLDSCQYILSIECFTNNLDFEVNGIFNAYL